MVDKIDKQILRLLQLDAKKTTKEIAAALGLTTTPVHERIKKLEREGYIQQYSIRIDRKKVGLMMMAFCSVSLKNHERSFIEKFERDIQVLDEVIDCYHIGGMFDYLLKVLVPDMDEYQRFISKKLADLDNIGTVQSSFVMSEIKHSTQIPDQFL